MRLIERAYDSAAHWHRDQKRRSGYLYITHPRPRWRRSWLSSA